MRRPSKSDRDVYGLAALLVGAGSLHFAVPRFFDAMIPRMLPGRPRAWTVGSAVVEIAVGSAIAVPATRRRGALAAALVFTGVLPANVTMAWRARTSASPVYKWVTIARMPLQAPLIAWALRVRRRAVTASALPGPPKR